MRSTVRGCCRIVGAVLALLHASMSLAGEAYVRFITCPIYRDTDAGRKSGCWLADDLHTGVRYDVSHAPTKPDWNHEILIEGRVSQDKDVCGGVVLDPVRVSHLPGACVPKKLPAENYPSRVFVLPKRNLRPPTEPRPQPSRPYTEKTFHLFFDFNNDFLIYQLDDYFLDRAVTYIRAIAPREVVVTGFAATEASMVSGRTLQEPLSIAQRRAETVSEALRRLGLPKEKIRTHWQGSAQPIEGEDTDGLAEPSRRRVEIRVKP